MAWPKEMRDKIRSGYIFDQLTLEMVALKCGVPYDTARRWKMQAAKTGDDWDKLRVAHTLAGDGLETVARTVLISLVVKCQATMDQLNNNPDVPAQQSVELLASLADSLSKAVSSSKKILPETDRLATALEVVQKLGAFISEHKPALYVEFVDVLESFASVLEDEFR
ncbi:DUF1804 family protein [Intestinirhabdus alba]|jgi:hypothetical protein|uniref:DUF1804 family protein n=1 Tax=Intestinirhabdus alba TaxID=2899544 RepID=A0A6L6ING9_9ENTR|nr:DUF1804 family protein [Intestinirhabdus alba]MTH47487.1 DUF1804 family protein [Intestinirhabdus alba]